MLLGKDEGIGDRARRDSPAIPSLRFFLKGTELGLALAPLTHPLRKLRPVALMNQARPHDKSAPTHGLLHRAREGGYFNKYRLRVTRGNRRIPRYRAEEVSRMIRKRASLIIHGLGA
jgi:hypothetical protein